MIFFTFILHLIITTGAAGKKCIADSYQTIFNRLDALEAENSNLKEQNTNLATLLKAEHKPCDSNEECREGGDSGAVCKNYMCSCQSGKILYSNGGQQTCIPDATTTIYIAIRGTSGFTLSNKNQWTPWPDLKKEFTLSTKQVVLGQYQAALPGGNTHVLSKMYLDGVERKATKSIAGNEEFATNSGFDVFELGRGKHTLEARYRTPGNVAMENGGSDWQTRTLHAVGLGAGSKILSYLNPSSAFTLSSKNQWSVWPGLSATISLSEKTVVMAAYQTSKHAGETHVLSKMKIDGKYYDQTKSINGDTHYAHNTGVWFGEMSAGQHSFEAHYRTPANVAFNGNDDWQTRAMFVVSMPAASILLNLAPKDKHDHNPKNNWTTWPGLSGTVTLAKTEKMMAYYQISAIAGNSHLLSKLYIDNKEMPQTRSISGDTVYATNMGTWMGSLRAGKHTFTVKYRTPASATHNPNDDWMGRGLVVVAL